jgi:hypothetical protein
MRRSGGTRGHTGVVFDYGGLNFAGAANGVDDAAEFDDRAVARALDWATLWSDRSGR